MIREGVYLHFRNLEMIMILRSRLAKMEKTFRGGEVSELRGQSSSALILFF